MESYRPPQQTEKPRPPVTSLKKTLASFLSAMAVLSAPKEGGHGFKHEAEIQSKITKPKTEGKGTNLTAEQQQALANALFNDQKSNEQEQSKQKIAHSTSREQANKRVIQEEEESQEPLSPEAVQQKMDALWKRILGGEFNKNGKLDERRVEQSIRQILNRCTDQVAGEKIILENAKKYREEDPVVAAYAYMAGSEYIEAWDATMEVADGSLAALKIMRGFHRNVGMREFYNHLFSDLESTQDLIERYDNIQENLEKSLALGDIHDPYFISLIAELYAGLALRDSFLYKNDLNSDEGQILRNLYETQTASVKKVLDQINQAQGR